MEVNIKDGKYYHYLDKYNYGGSLYNKPIIVKASYNFKYLNLEIGKLSFVKTKQVETEVEDMIEEIEKNFQASLTSSQFKNWGFINEENNCYINSSLQVLYNLRFYNTCRDLFTNQTELSTSLLNLFLCMRCNKETYSCLFNFIREFQKQGNESFGRNKQNDVYTFILELQKILLLSTDHPSGIKKILYDKNFQEKNLEERKAEIEELISKYPYLNYFQSICEYPNKRLELLPNLDITKLNKNNKNFDIVIPAKVLVFKSNCYSESVFKNEIKICDKQYEINSIVSYVGNSYSGHYYVHCKVGKDWIRFGDTLVKYDNNSHFRNAYIIFYKQLV